MLNCSILFLLNNQEIFSDLFYEDEDEVGILGTSAEMLFYFD